MIKEPVKPAQKYIEDHTYLVENSTEIQNGLTKKFHTSFEVNIHEDQSEKNTKTWQINKAENEATTYENHFMEVLHFMEKSTYPVTIKVDDKGAFLGAISHSENIERWKAEVQKLHEKYDNVEPFIRQYLEKMEDEELFYKNKFKESFWNLLFFAPTYFNKGYKYEQTIVWHAKTIGDFECLGIISAEKSECGFDAHFISETETTQEQTENLNKKFSRKSISYKVELNIRLSYHAHQKKYITKTADFKISSEGQILYRDTVNIA